MTRGAQFANLAGELAQILRQRQLQVAFQPVKLLESGEVAGYEALIRGPDRSPLATPEALLAAAYQTGRIVELDWTARFVACRAALAARFNPNLLLFLNAEPLALDSDCPPDLWPVIERTFDELQVVLEVTERSLERDPASLLDGLDRRRPVVAGFALDDVGSNPMTLSMLPLVAPAVIKLDLRVTQDEPTAYVSKVLDSVYEEAERTGAVILAEGIESSAHLRNAKSFGAVLGQGYYVGLPADLPLADVPTPGSLRLRADTPPSVPTPYDALPTMRTSTTTSGLLKALSRQLESCAAIPPSLFITHVPDAVLFGPAERDRLTELARGGVITAALGPELPADPCPGVRGPAWSPLEEFASQWASVALSACSSTAMLARATGRGENEFEFGVTHNRQSVIAAARCLLRRVAAKPPFRAHGLPT